MVMDRNNRSHAPKGTPGGGRFEPKGGDAPADDVTPPASRPDPHDLAAIFDRPDLARQIDFTLADGGRVSGYAMDCERLPASMCRTAGTCTRSWKANPTTTMRTS